MNEFEKEVVDFVNANPVDEIQVALEACDLLEQCAEEIENLYGRENELSKKVRDFLNN